MLEYAITRSMTGETPFNHEQQQLFDGLPYKYQTAVRLALGMTPEGFRDNYSPFSPLYGALEKLPLFNKDHARAVCNAMISSPDKGHRIYPACGVDFILQRDFEYGYALWDRLMGDPSRTIRRSARFTLEKHLRNCQSPDGNQVCQTLGQLTFRNACDLLGTLAAAEMDKRYYQLGAVVLSAADSLPPDDPSPQAPGTNPTVT